MNTPLLQARRARRSVHAGVLILLLCLLAPPAFAAEQDERFELAFTPFLPVRTLLQNYQPMRVFLEMRLQEPGSFITAPPITSACGNRSTRL